MEGERVADGRPKAADALLEPKKNQGVKMSAFRGVYAPTAIITNSKEIGRILQPDRNVIRRRADTVAYLPPAAHLERTCCASARGKFASDPAQFRADLHAQKGDVYGGRTAQHVIDGNAHRRHVGPAIYARRPGLVFDPAQEARRPLADRKGFNPWSAIASLEIKGFLLSSITTTDRSESAMPPFCRGT